MFCAHYSIVDSSRCSLVFFCYVFFVSFCFLFSFWFVETLFRDRTLNAVVHIRNSMPSDAYANKIYICSHCIALRRNECDAFQWLHWLVECVVVCRAFDGQIEETRPPDAIFYTMIRSFCSFRLFCWNLPGVKLRSVHSCIGCWSFG